MTDSIIIIRVNMYRVVNAVFILRKRSDDITISLIYLSQVKQCFKLALLSLVSWYLEEQNIDNFLVV